MNPLARYEPYTHSNAGCADLMTMAERELSAFFRAVTELFGSEQAELSAEDWLQELTGVDRLPASPRAWRLLHVKVSARLACRLNASSLSSLLPELQIA